MATEEIIKCRTVCFRRLHLSISKITEPAAKTEPIKAVTKYWIITAASFEEACAAR
jgi:hypothetical protein